MLLICSQLKELELIDYRKWKSPRSILSNESIVFIANHCQDLKFLNISGNKKLFSKGVNKVLKKCPKLESITVDYTSVNLNDLKKRPNGFPLLEIRKAQWEKNAVWDRQGNPWIETKMLSFQYHTMIADYMTVLVISMTFTFNFRPPAWMMYSRT